MQRVVHSSIAQAIFQLFFLRSPYFKMYSFYIRGGMVRLGSSVCLELEYAKSQEGGSARKHPSWVF